MFAHFHTGIMARISLKLDIEQRTGYVCINPKDARAREIAPDRIQLNTAVRPPTEEFVTALPNEKMAALTHLFQPTAEIIADFSTPRSKPMQTNAAAILAMLKRRPCTAQQIAEGFGLHFNEVSKYLGSLMKENKIRAERKKNVVYYRAATKGSDKSAIDS
ncbi:MAG: hypothetical protein AB1Z20_16465 [Desulfobacterales bacterium]